MKKKNPKSCNGAKSSLTPQPERIKIRLNIAKNQTFSHSPKSIWGRPWYNLLVTPQRGTDIIHKVVSFGGKFCKPGVIDIKTDSKCCVSNNMN